MDEKILERLNRLLDKIDLLIENQKEFMRNQDEMMKIVIQLLEQQQAFEKELNKKLNGESRRWYRIVIYLLLALLSAVGLDKLVQRLTGG